MIANWSISDCAPRAVSSVGQSKNSANIVKANRMFVVNYLRGHHHVPSLKRAKARLK